MKQQVLRSRLTELAEPGYAAFSQKLKVSDRTIAGVRTPLLTALAKELAKEGEQCLVDFLQYQEPWYEEIILTYKAFGRLRLSEEKTKLYLALLLPFNDSWATNDTISGTLEIIKGNESRYWDEICSYLNSSNPWDTRFSVITLMCWYLQDSYIDDVLNLYSKVESDHYYVIMGLGWAFATAFCKFREKTLPYLQKGILPEPVRKKAIQKCLESLMVSPEDKEMLKSLRRAP